MATFLLAVTPTLASAQAWNFSGTSPRDVAMAGSGVAGELPGLAVPADPAAVAGIDGEVIALSWRGSFARNGSR